MVDFGFCIIYSIMLFIGLYVALYVFFEKIPTFLIYLITNKESDTRNKQFLTSKKEVL